MLLTENAENQSVISQRWPGSRTGGQSRTMTTVKVVIQRADACRETASLVETALMAEAQRFYLRVSPAGSTVPLTEKPRKQEGWLELMFMLMSKQDNSCSNGPNRSSYACNRCSLEHKNAFNLNLTGFVESLCSFVGFKALYFISLIAA